MLALSSTALMFFDCIPTANNLIGLNNNCCRYFDWLMSRDEVANQSASLQQSHEAACSKVMHEFGDLAPDDAVFAATEEVEESAQTQFTPQQAVSTESKRNEETDYVQIVDNDTGREQTTEDDNGNQTTSVQSSVQSNDDSDDSESSESNDDKLTIRQYRKLFVDRNKNYGTTKIRFSNPAMAFIRPKVCICRDDKPIIYVAEGLKCLQGPERLLCPGRALRLTALKPEMPTHIVLGIVWVRSCTQLSLSCISNTHNTTFIHRSDLAIMVERTTRDTVPSNLFTP